MSHFRVTWIICHVALVVGTLACPTTVRLLDWKVRNGYRRATAVEATSAAVLPLLETLNQGTCSPYSPVHVASGEVLRCTNPAGPLVSLKEGIRLGDGTPCATDNVTVETVAATPSSSACVIAVCATPEPEFAVSRYNAVPTGYERATLDDVNEKLFSPFIDNIPLIGENCTGSFVCVLDDPYTYVALHLTPGGDINIVEYIRGALLLRGRHTAIVQSSLNVWNPDTVDQHACTVIKLSTLSTTVGSVTQTTNAATTAQTALVTTQTIATTATTTQPVRTIATSPPAPESTTSGALWSTVTMASSRSVPPTSTPTPSSLTTLPPTVATTSPSATALLGTLRISAETSFAPFAVVGSLLYNESVASLQEDITVALEVPRGNVRVTSLTLGSLVVAFEVVLPSSSSLAELASFATAISASVMQLSAGSLRGFGGLFTNVTGVRGFTTTVDVTSRLGTTESVQVSASTLAVGALIAGGVAVGVFLVLVLGAWLFVFCLRRRRHRFKVHPVAQPVKQFISLRNGSHDASSSVVIIVPPSRTMNEVLGITD